MEKKRFVQLTTEIAQNLNNQARVTEILNELNEDYEQVSTSIDTMTTQVSEFETQIKDLQKTNMNLFLKVSNPVPEEQVNTTEPMTYEGLIDSMGGSK